MTPIWPGYWRCSEMRLPCSASLRLAKIGGFRRSASRLFTPLARCPPNLGGKSGGNSGVDLSVRHGSCPPASASSPGRGSLLTLEASYNRLDRRSAPHQPAADRAWCRVAEPGVAADPRNGPPADAGRQHAGYVRGAFPAVRRGLSGDGARRRYHPRNQLARQIEATTASIPANRGPVCRVRAVRRFPCCPASWISALRTPRRYGRS